MDQTTQNTEPTEQTPLTKLFSSNSDDTNILLLLTFQALFPSSHQLMVCLANRNWVISKTFLTVRRRVFLVDKSPILPGTQSVLVLRGPPLLSKKKEEGRNFLFLSQGVS